MGGGFGGATVARHLQDLLPGLGRPAGPRVLLVAPENFLLFAPLLPEAASGTIEPGTRSSPCGRCCGALSSWSAQ